MRELLNFLKLISEETRLRILVLLFEGDLCVCQLTGITNISQPNISKHLARLRDAGLVVDEKRDLYTFYSLNLENPLYQNILNDIYKNLPDYPTLAMDNKKRKAANSYIEIMERKGLS